MGYVVGEQKKASLQMNSGSGDIISNNSYI